MEGKSAEYVQLPGGYPNSKQPSRSWPSFVFGFLLCFCLLQMPWPRAGVAEQLLERNGTQTDDTVVEVIAPAGTFVGASDGSMHGHLGIQYARAGRWEAPKPASGGSGWFNASHFGATCPRPGMPTNMEEDCLTLNVYAPVPARGDRKEKHAVMVFLHGGSFLFGSATDLKKETLRELVLGNGIVVVTVEYRLGVFGFLGSRRLQRQQGIGNFGILDQQLALQWVQRNIEAFGGDPSRVGLVGWSAGSASVSVHLAMPSSRGLFSRGIMLSGGFADWGSQTASACERSYETFLNATRCAKEAECWEDGVPCSCLMKMDMEELLDAQSASQFFAAPTIDGVTLPHSPMDALKQKKVHKDVPIIIGTAIEDSFVDIGADAKMEDFEIWLESVLPKWQIPSVVKIYKESLSEKNLYDKANKFSHEGWSPAYWAARRVRADRAMTCVARRSARAWHEATGAKAYWYLWGVGSANNPRAGIPAMETRHNQPISHPQRVEAKSCWPCPGAAHGTDLDYFFPNRSRVSSSAEDLVNVYPTFMADFLRSGDPNRWNHFVVSQANQKPAWPEVKEGGMWFQAGASRVNPDLRGEICDFWDEMEGLKP